MRKVKDVKSAFDVLHDRIWWNRHVSCGRHEAGRKAAAEIELKYGLESLVPKDDFEYGLWSGQMMALRWMLVSEGSVLPEDEDGLLDT